MNLIELRTKYPMYNDMPDEELADAVHSKFYSDLPREEFFGRIDFTPSVPEPGLIERGMGAITDWRRERKVEEFRERAEPQAPTIPPGYEDVAGMGPPIAEGPEAEVPRMIAGKRPSGVGRGFAPSLPEIAERGVAAGTVGLAETVGTGLEWLGGKLESEILEETGQTVADYWEEKRQKLAPPEQIQGDVISKPELLLKPAWWVYNVAEMAPSLGAAIIPGLGAYKYINIGGQALRLSPVLIARLAQIGAAVAGGIAGGSLEGAHTYREVKRRGGTEEEAAKAGELMTLASGALNAISFGVILRRLPKGVTGKILRFLTTGTTEAITEAAEEPTEAVILGDDIVQSLKQAATVAPIAGVTGILGGVGGGVLVSPISETPTPKVPPEVPKAPPPEPTPEVEPIPPIVGVPAVKEPPVARTMAEPREIAEKEFPKPRAVEEFPAKPPGLVHEVAPEKPIAPKAKVEVPAKPPPPKVEVEKPPTKEPWEMTTTEFYAKSKMAIRDKKTGQFHLATKGEAHHAEMAERLTEKGIKHEDMESGFILASGEFWTGQDFWLVKGTKPKDIVGIHKDVLAKALSEGKPVPKEVLADYPDLGKLRPTTIMEAELRAKKKQWPEGVAPEKIKGGLFAEERKQRPLFKPKKGPPPEKIKTFLGWVKRVGGIWDPSLKGEMREFTKQESGVPFIVRKTGQPFDTLVTQAIEDQWLPEGSTGDDLRSMLRQDIMAMKAKGPRMRPFADLEVTKEIEREFGKQVDEVIGDIGPQPGLSLRIKKKVPRKGEGIKFSNPEIEQRYQASKGVGREPIYFKVKSAFISLKNKATREYEHLPRTKEYAQLRFDLLRLAKQKGISSDRTLRAIQSITINLDKNAYDLFTRKVILDDLEAVAAKEKALPMGFDKDSLATEKGRVDAEVGKTPNVKDAVDKRKRLWTAIREDYIKAMDAIGFDVSEKLKNENYFRHQVLEYANAKGIAGPGKRLRTPTYRGFLRRRRGSQLDINTDYLEAEHEVMAQMLHDIEVARTIRAVEQNYDISDRLKKEASKKKVPWQSLVPEGYVTWQPREGNVFFMADSIPANIAKEMTASALETIGVSKEDLHKILAMGRKRKEFAIKDEVAATLDGLMLPRADNVISQANKKALRAWKIWTLISPRRFIKYNFRNLTGDADAAFMGNTKGFIQAPRATSELYDVYAGDKAMTPDLKDWFERGGMQSTLQALEMGELKKLKMFIDKYERRGKVTGVPKGMWQGYWKAARLSTDFREAILRYANYLEYLNQMKKHPQGKPNNFGASIPEEVMGLKDIKDRAFWLSNDLLGAYDRVSVMGHALREHLYPFWSWKEVNFKRYIRLFKNAADDRNLATMVGKKATSGFIKSPYTVFRIGRFIIKALAFWGMLQAWNNLMFPEEEESLSDEQRNTPHIVFGRDKEGKVIWFPRVGALGDFLEWFGLDQAPELARDWYQGKRTLREIVGEMGKSFVNVVVQGVTPFIKTPFEAITRRSLFPDVFRPGTIRDRGYHIARSLGLENEYKTIMDLPMEPYGRTMPKFFVYTVDPFAGAYRDIMAEKTHYMKKIGKYGEGFWINPRGNALYNFKLALRYGDKRAGQIYLKKYIALGGTPKGIERSLEYLHPLSGLNKYEMMAFVGSLKEDDRRKLAKAIRFYVDVLLGTKKQQVAKTE